MAVDVPELQPDEPEDTYHTQTLASVHDLIEREAATEALSLLEVAHQNALDERRLRPSVAILWASVGGADALPCSRKIRGTPGHFEVRCYTAYQGFSI